MVRLSISQAAREWGVTRQTIYRKADKGDISLSGASKPLKVDVSEMIRVFGNVTSDSHNRTDNDRSDRSLLQAKGDQIQHMNAEIQHLRSQLDNVTDQLGNAVEQLSKRDSLEQKLLEYSKPKALHTQKDISISTFFKRIFK